MTERRFVEYTPTGKLVKHGGSGTAYVHYGCRCEECVNANADRMARRRAKRYGNEPPETVQHGRVSTYTNWACRCDECLDAVREYKALGAVD